MTASRKPFFARLKCFFSPAVDSKSRKGDSWTEASSKFSSSSDTKVPIPLNSKSSSTVHRDHQPFSIAIIGAGIGGLALAIALTKRNVTCKIYDDGTTFSAVGAGIGLGSNSLAALDLIDPRFRDLYDLAKTGNEREAFRNSIFDALYAEPGLGLQREPPHRRGLVGAPYFERSSAHRRDLLNIMRSFVPPDTVQFSKRLSSIRHARNRVEVAFQDGESIIVDAVIGCDGINGPTRYAVLRDIAPERIAPEYCNMYIYRGIVPMAEAKMILGRHGGDSKRFMAKRCGAVVYPIARGCDANIMFYKRSDFGWSKGSRAVPCTRQEMESDFEGLDERLVKLLDGVEPLRWPVYHHRTTPTYCNGRICLLGDVAHATSPHQAAGSGQGLEDAVVLAHLLALVETPDQLESAFQAYDAVRRPRATRVVESSYDAGMMYCFEGPEGDNMDEIVARANRMFRLIWEHDLEADMTDAEARFRKIITMAS